MKARRLLSVCVALVLLATVSVAAASAPLASPCMSGGTYDPACDVDHNGTIDIFDIQLTAGHWGQTGTYNVYPAMVPKTGQTTCYDVDGNVIACPGTGQDGDWRKGVVWPDPRFTDNGNGTVTDNLTGLIWLKNASCFYSTWATALSDANTLNSGECGLTDGSVEGAWRLPNVRELHSLIYYGIYNPAVPNTAGTGQWTEGDPFTGLRAMNNYWSSTSYADDPYVAFIVHLYDGHVVGGNKQAGPYYVWPVRGGQ